MRSNRLIDQVEVTEVTLLKPRKGAKIRVRNCTWTGTISEVVPGRPRTYWVELDDETLKRIPRRTTTRGKAPKNTREYFEEYDAGPYTAEQLKVLQNAPQQINSRGW